MQYCNHDYKSSARSVIESWLIRPQPRSSEAAVLESLPCILFVFSKGLPSDVLTNLTLWSREYDNIYSFMFDELVGVVVVVSSRAW